MVCKRCGYQNNMEAKYCSGCGRKLSQGNRPIKKGLWMIVVCLLIAGIGVGLLIHIDTVIVDNFSKIEQVLPMEDGSVAVLYTDGTVKASGNTHFSEAVSDWGHVAQLYYNQISTWKDGAFHDESSLVGLTEDGSVLATDGSLSGWSNVKELYFTWQGVVGVTHDGRVLAEGDWEDASFLTELVNVEKLVYSSIQDIWGCLKKDGTVVYLGDYIGNNEICWNNVKELRDSGHAFYVIKNDGTVDGDMEDTYAGLRNAVKVVHYNDWVFGISADGRLLTHNNGNIYTNTGDMMVDVPGITYYGEEVDIRQFDQVKDIVTFYGLVLLNEDGTVDTIGEYPSWDLSDWDNIEKVYGTTDSDWEYSTLYGIRQDGSVITARYNWDRMVQTVTDQYRGWKLKDIYTGDGGVVGLTVDGKLVGDGIYENVDFSVFDR